MHRRVVSAAGSLALSVLLFLPAGAAAQTGSIAGQVVDETGGVLPGVTVEAGSPALIGGVRTAITDGSGQYGLEALRPGTYTVTFVLPGFSTFVREGIEIATGFSANVDATMTVGAVEETVTVSGASPVIDVQNVVHQENISNEILDTLPTGRTYWGYAALTVGAQTDILGGGQDVGGTVGDTWGSVIIHGSSTYDGEVKWDGMSVTASVTAGGGTGKLFFANQAAVEEVVMATGGMDAEVGFGAISMNFIPKEGGNAFSFYGIANGANEHMQNLNWDESLGARTLDERQVQGLKKAWDWGIGIGGPIVRDRLWFYTAHRWWGSQTYTTASFHNLAPRLSYGAADYQPDFDNPTAQENTTRDNNIRLTWQASERNKFTVSHADQGHCLCQFWAVFGLVDYNASMDYDYGDIGNTQASWTMPASNRLLFEAGVSYTKPQGSPAPQPEVRPNDVGVILLSPAFINVNAQTFSVSTPALYGTDNNFPNFTIRASMSYVTGSHNFKVGMMRNHLEENHPGSFIQNSLAYWFSAPGVPFRVQQFGTPRNSFMQANLLGIYAQDQWTIDRMTLNLGVRYDGLNGFVPAQAHPSSRFVPGFAIDRISDLPNYRDVNARLGVAYDLFGDGRTALKWNLGRYVNAIGTNVAQISNPMEALRLASNRSWDDANEDLHPNCNFDNFAANGECGAIIDPEFGTPQQILRARPDVIRGWNNRRANWQNSVAVQHELTDGLSVEVAWFRRLEHQLPPARQPQHRAAALLRVQHHGAHGPVARPGQRPDARRAVHHHPGGAGPRLRLPGRSSQRARGHVGGLQRDRRHVQRPAGERHHPRRRRRHGGRGGPRVLHRRQPDPEPARPLQLRAGLGGRDPGQVQRLGAAAVRRRLLVRLPEHSGRPPVLRVPGRRRPRGAGGDRGADRSRDGQPLRGIQPVPRRHRVLQRQALLVAVLPRLHVPRQLHRVRAPADPARPAVHQGARVRRRAHSRQLRHLQRL